jgi:hypothetical protein
MSRMTFRKSNTPTTNAIVIIAVATLAMLRIRKWL